jgi:hypothetical protein
MATHKEEVLDTVSQMPDDYSWAEILEALMFRAKVREGLAEADAGKLIDHDQVVENFRKWRMSAGPN